MFGSTISLFILSKLSWNNVRGSGTGGYNLAWVRSSAFYLTISWANTCVLNAMCTGGAHRRGNGVGPVYSWDVMSNGYAGWRTIALELILASYTYILICNKYFILTRLHMNANCERNKIGESGGARRACVCVGAEGRTRACGHTSTETCDRFRCQRKSSWLFHAYGPHHTHISFYYLFNLYANRSGLQRTHSIPQIQCQRLWNSLGSQQPGGE